ncbi:flagellar motor protein MotB [Alicyclobacillus tolerans]|uniref:Chemotaxis protein MotB n=1 Tax=Alicyclobacillus tolerans TaxID=90970 RepID=A0ABT9LY56_9BACL|nr:flagellar motor protein MotB [Alicyclobacillus tengchongensis]MDP9729203.1 chemotaxis protein MotB [Alicyclobacillus tengchongensis]
MPRRRKPEPPQNHERWLITYSDLITLLMIFFVIMYAMSSINHIKFESLSQSLAAALHKSDQIPLNNTGTTALISAANPTNTGDKQKVSSMQKQNDSKLNHLYAILQSYIQSHNLSGNVSLQNQQRGVQITLKDVVLFDTGSANIRPAAQKILLGLIPFFRSLQNQIVVEGYTDNEPIDTPIYPSNWELSAGRAMGVVRFLASHGIAPQRLSGIGYGQYRPIVPNNTPQNRQMNRRVNIVILRQGIQPGTINAEPVGVAGNG